MTTFTCVVNGDMLGHHKLAQHVGRASVLHAAEK